jgi:hypothetical protein
LWAWRRARRELLCELPTQHCWRHNGQNKRNEPYSARRTNTDDSGRAWSYPELLITWNYTEQRTYSSKVGGDVIAERTMCWLSRRPWRIRPAPTCSALVRVHSLCNGAQADDRARAHERAKRRACEPFTDSMPSWPRARSVVAHLPHRRHKRTSATMCTRLGRQGVVAGVLASAMASGQVLVLKFKIATCHCYAGGEWRVARSNFNLTIYNVSCQLSLCSLRDAMPPTRERSIRRPVWPRSTPGPAVQQSSSRQYCETANGSAAARIDLMHSHWYQGAIVHSLKYTNNTMHRTDARPVRNGNVMYSSARSRAI